MKGADQHTLYVAQLISTFNLKGVQGRMVLVVNFFVFMKKYFVVAVRDLVHDVEAIHDLY